MPLISMHRCQICGDVLFHDDFFSDPSQHVCLTVNGPGMIDPHANGCDIIKSSLFTKPTVSALQPAQKKRCTIKRADSEHLSEAESETGSERA